MSNEVIDIDEQFFAEELAAKRHRELSGILKAVKLLLEKPSDNSTAVAIGKLVTKLEGLKPQEVHVEAPKAPNVNVEVNQDKVISSVEQLSKDLLFELRKFNERPIPTKFDIEYNYGDLKTVNIQYTTADKLNHKK